MYLVIIHYCLLIHSQSCDLLLPTTVRAQQSSPHICLLQILHVQHLSDMVDIWWELAAARDQVHETSSTEKHI